MPNVAIKVKNLTKNYKDKKILKGISFDIMTGETIGVIGHNGAGKTTLMEIMMGIRKASTGDVVYYPDKNLGKNGNKDFIGVQLQETAMFQKIKVKEALEFYGEIYDVSKARIEEIINMFNLREYLDRNVNKLSGGWKHKVSLALAILHDPKVIFLDEPTTGLDPQARQELWEIIDKIKGHDKVLILSTHYMEEVSTYCDKVLIVKQGELVKFDTPDNLLDELIEEPKNMHKIYLKYCSI